MFLIAYDVEGVIVSRACTITYNYKHIRYAEFKGKSRKRLSVIALYHDSVFACVHIYSTRARHIKRIPRKCICEHRIVSYVNVSYVT